MSEIDPNIDFNWGNGSPGPLISHNTFSVRWTGYIEPLYSQTYRFYTITDDGVRLWVNNQLLIDNWQKQPATEESGTIYLAAGQKYSLRMEYFQAYGQAVARLGWSSQSQNKQTIPETQLYH